MNLLKSSEVPTDGHFLALYQHNDKLWSHTLRWNGGRLEVYNYDDAEFYEYGRELRDVPNIVYVKLDQPEEVPF